MKIFNITHYDLDGLGCNLLLRHHYGNKDVDVAYCGYDNANETLNKLLTTNEHEKYDHIYITDISISEEMANLVESEFSHKVVLIDHHINSSTEHLHKYDWVQLRKNKLDIDEQTSGTYMVWDYLRKLQDDEVYPHNDMYNCVLCDVVSNIDKYDTWLWKTKYNVDKPSKLNTLFNILGYERFIPMIEGQIWQSAEYYYCDAEFEIDDNMQLLLDLKDSELQRYIKSSDKNLYRYTINGYYVGIYYGEKYASEVCNALCELNDDLDAVACINMRSGISIRTIKDDVHVGELARYIADIHGISGNGHAKASGVTLTSENKQEFIKYIVA
ncbi:MAG: DHHA1 domain-containing protein [Paraclostridium sp.]